MIKQMFSIYDEKSQVYSPIYLYVHDGEALRDFMEAAADSQSKLSKYPSDFKIYKLGFFNDCTGVIESLTIPELFVNVVDLLKKEIVNVDDSAV